MNLRLSRSFNLSEFVVSQTAARLGIDNTPSLEVACHLQKLCDEVLQPLRDYLRAPIYINSGYRCPELNKAVGGVSNSQHLNGYAADIRVSPLMKRKVIDYIRNNCEFDQLINEGSWVHVSYVKGHNRKQVI